MGDQSECGLESSRATESERERESLERRKREKAEVKEGKNLARFRYHRSQDSYLKCFC